jgi:hypothetical protein
MKLNRRSIVERPLAKLSDDELHAITQLDPLLRVLQEPMRDHLRDLSYLAVGEMAERELAKTLSE